MTTPFRFARLTPLFHAAALIVAALTCAQTSHAALVMSTGQINNRAIFGIEFPEGQSFYGRAEMVYAVSLQRYQTGPYMVTEMVVDIGGSTSQFRIYATEPFSASDVQSRIPSQAPAALTKSTGVPPAVQKLVDRGSQTAAKSEGGLVVKDYPVSTHAKTVEFRLAEPADVASLYGAFMDLYARRGREAVVSRTETAAGTEEQKQEINRLGGTLFSFN